MAFGAVSLCAQNMSKLAGRLHPLSAIMGETPVILTVPRRGFRVGWHITDEGADFFVSIKDNAEMDIAPFLASHVMDGCPLAVAAGAADPAGAQAVRFSAKPKGHPK